MVFWPRCWTSGRRAADLLGQLRPRTRHLPVPESSVPVHAGADQRARRDPTKRRSTGQAPDSRWLAAGATASSESPSAGKDRKITVMNNTQAHNPKKGSRRAARRWLPAALLVVGMLAIDAGKGLVVDTAKERAKETMKAIHLRFPIDYDRLTADQAHKLLTPLTWQEIEAQVVTERLESQRRSFESELPRRWLPTLAW